MPRVYTQARNDKSICMIADELSVNDCRAKIAQIGLDWIATKRGRSANTLGPEDMALYYSDGKLAVHLWFDTIPTPADEPKFALAVGEIPGLGALN